MGAKRKKGDIRRQPRIPGGREHGSYGLPPDLYRAVRRFAEKHGATVPFTITNGMAYLLKYDLKPEEML